MKFDISRRGLLQGGAFVVAGGALQRAGFAAAGAVTPLEEVGYGQVTLKSAPHLAQMENVRSVLMGISDDSLLMPFRKMAGQDAPGEDIGGWYQYRPDYDYRDTSENWAGFAPGSTFGQWVSALARMYAVTGDKELQARVLRLNELYAQTISTEFYTKTRFPAYSFDKLVCGLKDSERLAGDGDAYGILDRTLAAATPGLPGHAVEHGIAWREGNRDVSWTWDESYTMPENLYLVSAQMGASGRRYREMADRYLDGAYFDPLARGEDVLEGRHAYSHVNALCSAMQAYMVGGSEKHLQAARNGFDMVVAQSFATGGWGADETLRGPGSDEVFASLAKSRKSFETPCGSYAHMKLTRYLLRCTREGRYGDSMERVMYNTILGVLPLEADGRSFYYSDYYSASVADSLGMPAEGSGAKRVYSDNRWPCCSGTMPQVVADYWINGYFHEPGAVWVNLYMPSVLRWNESGSRVEMELTGEYPETSEVRLRMQTSHPVSFALKLRIPAWADGATVRVNGKQVEMQVATGFATVRRRWRTGDVVELDLPMRLRIEALDAAHPKTAAVMFGPRVLFALGEGPVAASRAQVLAARPAGGGEWTLESATGPVRLVPFTSVGDRMYSTYIRVDG